jgi:hypothetical protein
MGYSRVEWTTGPFLIIEVINMRETPNFVSGVQVPLRNGNTMFFPYLEGERQVPFEIRPNESVKLWYSMIQIAHALQEAGSGPECAIDVEVTDAAGRKYVGSTKVLVKEWARHVHRQEGR